MLMTVIDLALFSVTGSINIKLLLNIFPKDIVNLSVRGSVDNSHSYVYIFIVRTVREPRHRKRVQGSISRVLYYNSSDQGKVRDCKRCIQKH